MSHHDTLAAPSKASLSAWWKQFTLKNGKREVGGKGKGQGIFGVDLKEGIRYARVPICLAGPNGKQPVCGYIPTIVAKCGMYLKDQATTTEGIFRLSGSAKRIKELQTIFDSPPLYGKTLTWAGYSVHDAANILRRYLNHLPDPVIPLNWYDSFRAVHLNYKDPHSRVENYIKLIQKLPKENQQLLLYILDLLAVFSSKSTQNLMPSKNLASIFQPGVLSHPAHDMAPEQYKLSQEVLEFLIDYQNYFLPSGETPSVKNNRYIKYENDTREKEPSDLNDVLITPPPIRRSSSSLKSPRSRSEEGIETPKDLTPADDEDPSAALGRKSSRKLSRSKTLPGKKSKRSGGQEKGVKGNEVIGSSNDENTSRSRRSLRRNPKDRWSQSLPSISVSMDSFRKKKSISKLSRKMRNKDDHHIGQENRSSPSLMLPTLSQPSVDSSINYSTSSLPTRKKKLESQDNQDKGGPKKKGSFLSELRRMIKLDDGGRQIRTFEDDDVCGCT